MTRGPSILMTSQKGSPLLLMASRGATIYPSDFECAGLSRLLPRIGL